MVVACHVTPVSPLPILLPTVVSVAFSEQRHGCLYMRTRDWWWGGLRGVYGTDTMTVWRCWRLHNTPWRLLATHILRRYSDL